MPKPFSLHCFESHVPVTVCRLLEPTVFQIPFKPQILRQAKEAGPGKKFFFLFTLLAGSIGC